MIQRDLHAAARSPHDLIVVGGGIYGVAMTLEAARHGLRAVLVERDDFGHATSWNSLRILHGGLRYLQTLDLPRFAESVAERRWFCQHFPDLVRPLPCLMPLYKRGLKRREVFRVALWVNDWLSRRRNVGVPAALHLPPGRVLDAQETLARFPRANRRGLQGAALWHDAVMLNSQRILMEMLRWACSLGAMAINYAQALDLLEQNGRAAGLRVEDRLTGGIHELRSQAVINCAGPWSASVAASLDRQALAFHPSLAFNVLLDHAPLAQEALAVMPRRPGSPVYFMHPWRGRILAGTVHTPWNGQPDRPMPSESQLQAFLDDLNDAVPDWRLQRDQVLRIYAGLLPATRAGSDELAVREVIQHHADRDGPRGLWSVCGVKFTTARLVAQKTLTRAWAEHGGLPPLRHAADTRPAAPDMLNLHDPADLLAGDLAPHRDALLRLVREEAVVCVEDLIHRRADWGAHPADANALAQRLGEALRLPHSPPLARARRDEPADHPPQAAVTNRSTAGG